uniref:Transmembrane protein 106B-like n=2 Tax=Neolamprologus brichardi TaxID=32507 RepID=A0A3Q4H3F1_NEOBR
MNLMLTSLVKLTVGLQPSPLSQGGSPQWGQRCAAGLTQSRFALMTQQRHICPTFFSDLRTWFCVAGQESKLVAVIPCTDQRLRPRHTKLYVALSVGLCLLVSVLVLFFLFPRSVILSPVAVSSSSVYFTHDGVQINITNVLNITNNNFAAVQAYNLTVQALNFGTVLGTVSIKNVASVKPLSVKTYSFMIPIQLTDPGLSNYCKKESLPVHILYVNLQ